MPSLREALTANAEKLGITGGGERSAPVERQESVKHTAEPVVRADGHVDSKPVNDTGAVLNQPVEKKANTETVKAEPVKAQAAKQEPAKSEPARASNGQFVSRKFPTALKKELEPLWNKPGGHTPEEWSKIQEDIDRYHSESSRNSQQLSDQWKQVQPDWERLQRMFTPYKDVWARNGQNGLGIVEQLFAQAQFADKDFAGFIREQARQRGYDLAQLVQPATGPSHADPAIAALQNQIAQLTQHVSSGQQQAQSQLAQAGQEQWNAFKTATNSDGSPKHPHFSRVEQAVRALIVSGQKHDLPSAYEAAIYMDPEVRNLVIAEQNDARDRERAQQVEQAAAAAKSAAGNLSGVHVPQGLPKGSNVRAHLQAAMAKLNGGARVN